LRKRKGYCQQKPLVHSLGELPAPHFKLIPSKITQYTAIVLFMLHLRTHLRNEFLVPDFKLLYPFFGLWNPSSVYMPAPIQICSWFSAILKITLCLYSDRYGSCCLGKWSVSQHAYIVRCFTSLFLVSP